MKSRHQGRYWVGTFERAGDRPQGTLTSAPFVVTKRWGSFLVGGGRHAETCVELVRADTGKVFYRTSGEDQEDLKRVAVDLNEHQGREVFIRLVDGRSDGWGHINFDDFRLHDERPPVPQRTVLPGPDVYAHAGLSPEEAARAMTVPPGFEVRLFAGEPDVVQPIAMTIDERGRVWVAEAYSYPIRVADDQARDRIVILEDQDRDGRFDKRTVFAERLNLVSGLEVGHGGVWVGAAPYLMFFPDRDRDDRPDGPAQILLDGWGLEDTHETLNSFIWGPDGWLYGCHGVFTHSRVGKPGTPDAERVPINAGVWRYHPTRHEFEVFAHGTSNPWGVDFDAEGQCFIEACVIPHLYHMVQGGRYERQAGSHFNPYTYDDIKTIADHRHYVGANPHGGNGRSDSAGGGHAHAGLMIYNGSLWPAEYRGGLFMNNIHGARLNHDVVVRKGSGFVGSHRPDFVLTNDAWSQIVALREGPDGAVYLIDWYDKNQCHRTEPELHDRSNGRVFRLSYGEPRAVPDLVGMSAEELVRVVVEADEAVARLALRLIRERGLSAAERRRLYEGVRGGGWTTPVRLRGLWALHGTGGLEEAWIGPLLGDPSEVVRAWTIQLACEQRRPSEAVVKRMVEMAGEDPSPVVRLYLASAVQRLGSEYGSAKWAILEGLSGHGEDAEDPNLPWMVWYGAEPLAEEDASRALALAAGAKLPQLLPWMTRRVVALGTPEALALVVERLGREGDAGRRRVMLGAIQEGLQGRRQVEAPAVWATVGPGLMTDADEGVRALAVALGTTFGDQRALDAVRATLVDAQAGVERRTAALASLLKARDPRLPGVLRELIREPGPLRQPALRGLAAFDDEGTPGAVLEVYPGLTPAEKRDALTTLAARVSSAVALLDAVGSGRVPAADLTADLIRNLRNLKDEVVDQRIAEVWGQARETPAEKARLIEQYREIVYRGYSDPPDPMLGRAVWARTCGQCHMLFGIGPKIGPDLTGSNRADLEYILANVVDPSALVGKDYQATVIATADGRTLTGIVQAEDPDSVTLVMQNETIVIPKSEIEERKLTEQSLMPEDQWANLSAHEIRSLVAYLASPQQVPMLATPDNAVTFYNGKDLSGWQGDPELWTVEDGEIVGRTQGLERNAFLVSDLAAADFRLRFQVKLVGNEGNSGVQFRSEALPDGEMRGYQADIGPGWWGKLYEENGRALLWDRSGEAHVRPGDWNDYEIIAQGSRIVTRINGQTCVDLDDPAGLRRGVFGLQLHSGGPTEVRFRNLTLEVLGPEPAPQPSE
jgi:putative membrane-bound dehydrogenase-like protein